MSTKCNSSWRMPMATSLVDYRFLFFFDWVVVQVLLSGSGVLQSILNMTGHVRSTWYSVVMVITASCLLVISMNILASPTKVFTMSCSMSYLQEGYTPMMCAAGCGNVEVVKLLLTSGAKVDQANVVVSHGITLSHWGTLWGAVKGGRVTVRDKSHA